MKDYKKLNPSFQRGQALITAVVFFLIIATTLSMAVLNPVLRQVKQVGDFARTRGSLFTSQSVNEDALYRLRNNMKFVSPSTLSLNGYSATATSTVIVGGIQIDSSGSGFGLIRNIQTHLTSGNGTSFNYGVQVGDGGLMLENSSSVSGNVYSNGPITGSGNNLIRGDAVSAKTTGRVSGVHATSSVYANTIQNSTIDKDAYYQTISGSTVGGTSYPGSPDQATSTFPVSDAQIADWESDAAAGGTISSPCPYIIISDTTIGPKKINCDLEISGDPTVTLSGALWVVGSVTIKNTAIMAVSPSLSGKSVAIIADNPANRTTDSKISLENSAVFQGSGAGSYVLFVSQNNSAEQGGGEKAVNTNNSVDGDLLVYAGHGEIQLQNSINVKEVTAYRIRLKNSAEVIYETGLANLLFTSGPSGGYVFDKWREVQ